MIIPLKPVELLVGVVSPVGEVWLRPWRASDVEAVWRGFSDPDVAAWNPFLPFTRKEQAAEWLAAKPDRWRDGSHASWAIVARGEGDERVLGSVGLNNLDRAGAAFPEAHSAVSYWTLPAARGLGLASRGAAMAADWALTSLHLPRVQLYHDVRNLGSCRVAEKAGFELEGTTRHSAPGRDGWVDEHLHARVLS